MDGRRRHVGTQGTVVGRYLLGRVVGKGVSSEVRLATDTANNELVALKIMQKEWIWKNDMSSLVRREIDIMRELDHPCVVKLIEVFNSETHVFMAMETVDGRKLHEELTHLGRIDETRARDLFQQLMMAVEYLHSIGVAHRDLKLENVLLTDDGQSIKVTDFGLAARLDEWEGGSKQKKKSWGTKQKLRRQQTACGTHAYVAPEVVDSSVEQRYDARGVDTWCAGVCLYTMVTGNLPFQASNVDDALDALRTKEPMFPKQLSPLLTDLLRGMLCKDPSKRLNVAAVLTHPWTTLVSDLTPPLLQPGEIEEREQLAEAARQAIREARLAASEAERAAAAAAAAETNAAKALAAVKLASSTVRPAIRRSASADSQQHHRRSTSVDSHLDAAAVPMVEAVRLDHEWSSRGHERTWSADDSVYAGGGGGGGNSNTGATPQTGSLSPPPPVVEYGERAAGEDGATSGSGVLVATKPKPSAWQRLVTRRAKFGRSRSQSQSQSVSRSDGSAAESGASSAAKPAEGDGGPVVSKAPQLAAPQSQSQGEGPSLAGEGAGKRVRGGRSSIERSLSSAFVATSASDPPASTAPPPIEQSLSFDLTVAPAAAPATGVGNRSAGNAHVSNDPRLSVVPDEAGANASVTSSKLEPAAEIGEQSDDLDPPDAAVDKVPADTAEAETESAGIPCPALSTAPTMSMSPPNQDRPSNSAGTLAPTPLRKEGWPLPSSTPVIVSPVGATSTTPATETADTVPAKHCRPPALHRPERAPSSEPALATPAPSSSSHGANLPVAEKSRNASAGGLGSTVLAVAVSRGESPAAEAEGGQAVSRKAGSGSGVDSPKESLPAEGEEAVSRAASEVANEAPRGEGRVEREVAGGIVLDAAGTVENVDEGVNEASVEKEKEVEKADGTPPVAVAKEAQENPTTTEDEGVIAAAAAAAAAAAMTTTEKPVHRTADGDPEQRSLATAASTPLVGAAATGHGSGGADGVAVSGDGSARAPAAASEDMEGSAKTRPLLRSKHLADPSVNKAAAIGTSRPDGAPAVAIAAASVPETKADVPALTVAARDSSQGARQFPGPATSKANEASESAPSVTTKEPKADPSPGAVGVPVAPAAGDSLAPATDTKAPPTAAAAVSPRATPGAREEKNASSASLQESCEPSSEVPAAEAAEKVEMAGQADRAVAPDAATSELRVESTPLAELAAASNKARVESSRAAASAVLVSVSGEGEKDKDRSASGGAVEAPTSLGDTVTGTHAERPVPADTAAFDEAPVEASGTSHPRPGSPPSPPSYDELFSHPPEEETAAKDEDANGDAQEDNADGAENFGEGGVPNNGQPTETKPPAARVPAAFVALDDAIAALEKVSSAPTTAATPPAQQAAEHGADGEEAREGQSGGGERAPSRSPTRGAVAWESINPFDGGGGGGNAAVNGSSSSSSSAAVSSSRSSTARAAAEKPSPPRVYQPSTFKELMTGMKDYLVTEESAAERCNDDDDAESRYRRGEQEVENATPTTKGGLGKPPAASAITNIRKLAEAESIWGTGPAADTGADEDASARKVSGRYLRSQFRPQSLQPQRARGRQGERGSDRSVSTERQRNTIVPAGHALGRPSAVFESPADAAPAAAGPEEEGGQVEKPAPAVAAAVKPRKRGKSIGKKISRMFGRKTEVN